MAAHPAPLDTRRLLRAQARAHDERHGAVLRRLEPLALRTGVSPRAVAGFVVVGLVVLGVLAARVVAGHAAARPVHIAPVAQVRVPGTPAATTAVGSVADAPGAGTTTPAVVAGGPSASIGGPGALPTPTSSAGGAVVVDVAGAVRHPGVVRLPAGARVEDALTAAGGAKPGAGVQAVNLARGVQDGEQVVVPARLQRAGSCSAEPPTGATTGSSGTTAAAGGSSSGPAAAGGTTAAGQVVDLNSADATSLDSLPGVGPVLAQRILDWRRAHGRFSSVDELGEVSGIGDATLERLRPVARAS